MFLFEGVVAPRGDSLRRRPLDRARIPVRPAVEDVDRDQHRGRHVSGPPTLDERVAIFAK